MAGIGFPYARVLGVLTLLAACAAAPESLATDRTDSADEPLQGSVAVARILSPETRKYYDIPVPPGLCLPDPKDPFSRLIARDRRHPDFDAAFVPCKLAEGAPRRVTNISSDIPVPPGRTPEDAISGILSEIDASLTPAGKYLEFPGMNQLDAAIRASVSSPDFPGRGFFAKLVDRDEDVRFFVIRATKETTLVQVHSLVAVDGHIFHLMDVEYLPLQDGGTSVANLYARRKDWIRQIRAANHR